MARPAQAATEDIVISEISPSGDWVEFQNIGTTDYDLSGFTLTDNSPGDPTHSYTFPEKTIVPAGGYITVDTQFGLGKANSVKLFAADITASSSAPTVAEFTWTKDPGTSIARCDFGNGPVFAESVAATRDAANSCKAQDADKNADKKDTGKQDVGKKDSDKKAKQDKKDQPKPDAPAKDEPAAEPKSWPGSSEVISLDKEPTFLTDTSGLDFYRPLNDPNGQLWVIDNDFGNFWGLSVKPDGSFTFLPGYENGGKHIVLKKDAGVKDAAGPDTEGLTIVSPTQLFAAAERDNSDKKVNKNMILLVDPTKPGPGIVTTQEWDITSALPQVKANKGIEAIEYVPDSYLVGKVWDQTTGSTYTGGAGYGGLFFVALEDNGHVYAFNLNPDGSYQLVSEFASGLPAAMALDYDTVTEKLWVKCDNTCQNKTAVATFNGTEKPETTIYQAPAGLPVDMNFEGFAVSDLSYCVAGKRPVWYTADGEATGALRTGSIACSPILTPIAETWRDSDDITIIGLGYTPNELVTLVSTQPDGSKVTVGTISANAQGRIKWTGKLPINGTGKYTITGTDESGLTSNFVYERTKQKRNSKLNNAPVVDDHGDDADHDNSKDAKKKGTKSTGGEKQSKPTKLPKTGV